MHILVFTDSFYPERNAPAARCYDHARRWVKAGHEVSVITGAPNAPRGEIFPGYRNKLFQREMIEGINVVRVWTFVTPNVGWFLRSLDYLSYFLAAFIASFCVRRVDVILGTTPHLLAPFAAMVSAFFRRVPWVLELRDIWPASLAAVGFQRFRPLISVLRLLERMLYKHADRIIYVSRGFEDYLKSQKVPANKLVYIPNGADLNLFAGQRGPRRALNGGSVIGYFGTIGLSHGLDVVLQAARNISLPANTRFVLCGDGAERQLIEELKETHKISNIDIIDSVPRNEMPALMARCDALLVHLRPHPVFDMVIPSKLFDAAAMGKPVLAGLSGVAADLVKENDFGIVFRQDDAAALVAACRQLLADPSEMQRLGRNGRNFAKKHSRDRLADDIILCFLDIFRSGRPSRSALFKTDIGE